MLWLILVTWWLTVRKFGGSFKEMVWLGDEVVHFGVAVSHFEYVVQLRLLAISPRFESGISTNDTGTLNLLKIT